MRRIQVKPCPFCGSAVEVSRPPMLGGYIVICPSPDCQTHGRLSGDREKAIAAWNRRACSELADLKREVRRLRRDCAEAYQAVGAAMLGDRAQYTDGDVVRLLDNLSAAANGTPRPHDDLLPWPTGVPGSAE